MQLDMTKGSPLKLILTFTIPLVLGNLFQQLYSMADAIIVGNYLGNDALAAVGATGTINFFFLGFVQGITAGFTVLVSQRYGAKDYEAMKKSIGNAIILSIYVVLIVTAVSVYFMRDLLEVMNTPADIFEQSYIYILIIYSGIFVTVIYNLSSGFLRAIGNSRAPLYFLIFAVLVNIVLDIVFIAGVGMGVEGAAYATVISQALSGVLCIIYIIKKVPLLHINRGHLRRDKGIRRIQLRIGLPMALQFSITAIGALIIQAVLNLFGSTAIAAYTAAVKVEQLATLPLNGVGVAIATYTAQNKGANKLDRVRKGVASSIKLIAGYSVASAAVVLIATPYLLRLFIKEDFDIVLPYAAQYMNVIVGFFFPLGLIFIYRNAMQGAGYTFLPTFGGVIELVSRCVVAAIAANTMSFMGVCFANSFTWFITAVFLGISYYVLMGKAKKKNLI